MAAYGLSLDEACAIIGISRPTARAWIKNGRLVASRKSDSPKSDYIITRDACIAAIKNPLHTVPVSAGNAHEEKKSCRYSAEGKPGTQASQRQAESDLSSLLGQRTKGRQTSSTTS